MVLLFVANGVAICCYLLLMVLLFVANCCYLVLMVCKKGFHKRLPKVIGVDAESGVAAQPVGFEETRRGARNRLKAAKASEEGTHADFCCSKELLKIQSGKHS